MTKRILVLQGGGIRGLIQLAILEKIERNLGKKCYEIFDMIIGTSVGAIIGGALAYGVPASTISHLFLTKGDLYFKPINKWNPLNWLKPKYDRKTLVQDIISILGKDTKLGDCKTKFICASHSLNDYRPHFFKSDDPKDKDRLLWESIVKSFAALYFFGSYSDDKDGHTWIDPGIFTENNPIDYALTECDMMKLFSEKVKILNLGTGYIEEQTDYSVTKDNTFIGDFIDIQLLPMKYSPKYNDFKALSRMNSEKNLEVVILNIKLEKSLKALDSVQYKLQYVSIGNDLHKTLNYEFFE